MDNPLARFPVVIGGLPDGRDVRLVEMPKHLAAYLGGQFAAMDPWLVYGISAQHLTSSFSTDEPGAPRIAILVGDAVAGVVVVQLKWLRGPYLRFFGVLGEFQSRGIGRMVLEWFEAGARAGDSGNAWVVVSEVNSRARAFYEANGFCHCADIDDLVVPEKLEVLLRKQLS